jgi:hypothetical protein
MLYAYLFSAVSTLAVFLPAIWNIDELGPGEPEETGYDET